MNHTPDSDRSNTGSGRYQEYAKLVDRELRTHRDRCRRLAYRHRIWFRTSGMAVIVFSIALPAVTNIDIPARNVLITTLASLIAGLSALRAFYLWDRRWRLYRSQDTAMTALLTRWELGVIRISGAAPPDAAERVHELTEKVLEEARELVNAQYDEFFATIAWPQRSG
ncbi:SLATT domain-containing protein [Amycolatopsis taiwanensis]|uniref:DUF4231 domain-containing protein n=2 Tax=Amycolatopsis taiwanensis TaxID=342230 RepID=A0A9W6R758_9PSEU|nr:SLATT domain-containing protein [Amycolatopsis taiwanensis]GLY70319.1 hypothetical protein Atai01_69380 [Amycolatopsis taiwanensis]